MAAQTFGKIGEFDPNREEWTQYVERLDYFFQANGIAEADQKRAVFLTVIGPTAFRLLRSLITPDKPGERDYEALVEAVKEHHSPIPSEIVQRFKFNSRFRQQGESVSTFVSELRSLAEFCNFKATLDDMLRDRLVCGINDDNIQRRLLSETKLTSHGSGSSAGDSCQKCSSLARCYADRRNPQVDSPTKEAVVNNSQVLSVREEQPHCGKMPIPRSQMPQLRKNRTYQSRMSLQTQVTAENSSRQTTVGAALTRVAGESLR